MRRPKRVIRLIYYTRLSHVPLGLLYASLTRFFLLFLLSIWSPSPAAGDTIQYHQSAPVLERHPNLRRLYSIFDDDALDREWVVRNVLGGMAAGFGLRGALSAFPGDHSAHLSNFEPSCARLPANSHHDNHRDGMDVQSRIHVSHIRLLAYSSWPIDCPWQRNSVLHPVVQGEDEAIEDKEEDEADDAEDAARTGGIRFSSALQVSRRALRGGLVILLGVAGVDGGPVSRLVGVAGNDGALSRRISLIPFSMLSALVIRSFTRIGLIEVCIFLMSHEGARTSSQQLI